MQIEPRLSVAKLAEMWGCSRAHVYGLVERGELGFIRVGSLIRFRPEDVREFEQCRAQEPRNLPTRSLAEEAVTTFSGGRAAPRAGGVHQDRLPGSGSPSAPAGRHAAHSAPYRSDMDGTEQRAVSHGGGLPRQQRGHGGEGVPATIRPSGCGWRGGHCLGQRPRKLRLPKSRKPCKSMVLLEGIELSTSPLPRGCSTTELQQRPRPKTAGRYSPRAKADASRPPDPQGLGPSADRSRVDGRARRTILCPMENKQSPSRHLAVSHLASGKLAARKEREAAALRANLRKRKQQAQAREKPRHGPQAV